MKIVFSWNKLTECWNQYVLLFLFVGLSSGFFLSSRSEAQMPGITGSMEHS